MTTPSVIVATEQEQTVRLYVGAPSNGGMNQVAQLSLAHPINAHDLADMAMSLGIQFGWLTAESNIEVGTAPAKLVAPALPPVIANATESRPTYPSDLRMMQMVKCPAKGCTHTARRKNMSQHLMSGKHGWTRDNANRAARLAQPIADAPAEPAPAPAPVKPKRASVNSKVGRKGGVSGLGIPANMRYGTVGRRELERVGYPKILEWMSHAEQVNSQQLAKHFGESTSAAKHWLNALAERGDVVRTNPDAGANETHWYAVAQPAPPTLAQPVTSSVGFGHEHEEHTQSPTQTQTESEHQSV